MTETSRAVPRVLLVDDEPLVARIFTRVLNGQADVRTASDAEEGIRVALDEGPFDLIVCDLGLRGGSGVSVHRTLAERAPALADRLVVLTGGATTPEAQEFLRSMGERVLMKPFAPEQLRDLVRRFAASPAPAG
jgi:DNA-binding NarL/FixJ family response regulator